MKLFDIILLLLLLLWGIFAVTFQWKKRKNGECSGCFACTKADCSLSCEKNNRKKG